MPPEPTYDVTITIPSGGTTVTIFNETGCTVAETATTYTMTKTVGGVTTTWTVDRGPGMVMRKVPVS